MILYNFILLRVFQNAAVALFHLISDVARTVKQPFYDSFTLQIRI